MAIRTENQYHPDIVEAPGETLREVLADRGLTQAELAERTGRPKKTINEIIQGKAAITPETALQLERALGISATFWNNLERNFRENLAQRDERRKLESRLDWMKKFPVNAMIKRGWLERRSDSVDQLRELLNFLGVAAPEQWEELLSAAAFRKSMAFDVDLPALAAWLRKGELEGRRVPCGSFDRMRFQRALRAARELTHDRLSRVFETVQKECAEAGVAVAIVPELPRTRVNGASRWLSKDRALIQLSVRHRREDVFWFSFFHEAAHVLQHGKRGVFVHLVGTQDERELEADRVAADLLIDPAGYRHFTSAADFTAPAVQRFAEEIGVHPGIVVGRLQHDQWITYSQLNDLRRSIDPDELLAA